jgi:L-methionine (R)-S-oxide reductase
MSTSVKNVVPFSQLHAKTRTLIQQGGSVNEVLARVAQFLHQSVLIFDWVGFYIADTSRERMLILGPYVGAHTDHTEIPFGRGICGQSAETKETFVVQDVSKEANYLSCSDTVQSEIVVPILKNGEFVAQLDIDSHALSPFTPTHKAVLEAICADLAPLF